MPGVTFLSINSVSLFSFLYITIFCSLYWVVYCPNRIANMDAILEILDPYVFDYGYAYLFPQQTTQPSYGNSTGFAPSSASKNFDDEYSLNFGSSLPRDDIYRQSASILMIAGFGAAFIYVISAALSYYFVFDRRLEHHPRFLKNQIKQEIQSSFFAIPIIDLLTLPFFLGEVRGHSLLYTNIDEYGWSWLAISTILYMVFNDLGIYWIHRLEHHPSIYKYVHKPHHKWIGKLTSRPSPVPANLFSSYTLGCHCFPPR